MSAREKLREHIAAMKNERKPNSTRNIDYSTAYSTNNNSTTNSTTNYSTNYKSEDKVRRFRQQEEFGQKKRIKP